MARNTYGLDLGSYEIKVYDKKQDTIWKEKNVLAVQDKKEIIAIGEDAYQMYEKTPPDIEVAFPMRDGVIASEYSKKEPTFQPGCRICDCGTN